MKAIQKIRVVIIDDQEVARIGLRTALESVGQITIVAEGETESDALHLAGQHHPDVLLFGLNTITGQGRAKGILSTCYTIRSLTITGNTHVLVLSRYAQKGLVHVVIQAGAAGFLLKDEAMNSSAELARVIVHIARKGRLPFSHTLHGKLCPCGLEMEAIPPLTPRRIAYMQAIADNPHLTIAQVAAVLGIAESTLRNNLSAISRALDTSGLNGALVECLRLGLVHISH